MTLCLYAYSWSIYPKDIAIEDIGQGNVGSLIRTDGHVKSIMTIASGDVKGVLLDYGSHATLPMYIPKNVAEVIPSIQEIVPGCHIRVTGELQEYRGVIEIAVSNPSLIEVLTSAVENVVGIGVLAQNPSVFQGMAVSVRGEIVNIQRVSDQNKALISSGNESLWVDVSNHQILNGHVDLFGVALYNEKRSRFEIKVSGSSDGMLPHPSPVPDGYEVVLLQSVLADPDAWISRKIAILGAWAVAGEIIGTSFELYDFADDKTFIVSCFVYGWDQLSDDHGIVDGMYVEFFGTWDYYSRRAQWQIVSDGFTLQS